MVVEFSPHVEAIKVQEQEQNGKHSEEETVPIKEQKSLDETKAIQDNEVNQNKSVDS